jgi:hypothetical protein
MAGFTWQQPPSAVFPAGAEAYVAAIRAGVLALANSYAPEIEAWMKENAAWTDRTGNARQTLWAEVLDMGERIVLAFGHGMDYGTFLELDYGGRYAIVTPALDRFGPLLWRDTVAMLR